MEAVSVYIEPKNVWEFYATHQGDLAKQEYKVAESNITGDELWLATDEMDEPNIYLLKAADESVVMRSYLDAERAEQKVNQYVGYLLAVSMTPYEDDEEDDEYGFYQDMVYGDDLTYTPKQDRRVTEVLNATRSYLNTVIGSESIVPEGGIGIDRDTLVDDVISIVCEYLFEEHGISVWFPSAVDGGYGEPVIADYPFIDLYDDEEEIDDI